MDVHTHDGRENCTESFGSRSAETLALLSDDRHEKRPGATRRIQYSMVGADVQVSNDPFREPVRRIIFAKFVSVLGINEPLVQSLEYVFIQEIHIVPV